MKVLSKENEQLVDVALSGGKDAPLKAHVKMGEIEFDSPDVETSMACVGDDLETTIRIPGVVNFKLLLEPADVKALKGMMGKGVVKFMMKSFF